MLLASGRDADVYAYGEDLVLRRYRDGRSAEPEAATIRDLVAAGYPAPQIKYVRGPDMVMERVQGPSLAEAVLAGLAPEEAGATLAALHDRLHALPWPTAGPGESLVHLDLHPLNVLVRRTEPVVIDWANARPGDPSLDVALTALILAQVVVTEGMLASVQLPEDASRTTVLRMLGAFCHSICTGYQDQIAAAAVLRREDPNLTSGERNCLSTAVEVVRSIG